MISDTLSSQQPLAVLGSGSWGTALAILCSANFPNIKLYGRDKVLAEAINRTRNNTKYLPNCPLPDNIEAVSDLADIANFTSNFLLVTPSHGVEEQLKALLALRQNATTAITVMLACKGFAPPDGRLLSEVCRDICPAGSIIGMVSGPSFAGETAKGLPTALTVACDSLAIAKSYTQWFTRDHCRLYFSDDLVGVQIGAAVKNIIAIATGISDGLGFGANARAALITRGLNEIIRLGLVLGGRRETFMGLTGMGDLILTCTDDQSRNRRFGLALGAGNDCQAALTKIGQEVAGYHNIQEVMNLATDLDVDMPITAQVYDIVYRGANPRDSVSQLISRSTKTEF